MKAVRRAVALARKELRDLLRERTILTLLFVQFFIAAFSAFLMVGLSGLYDPGSLGGFPGATVAYVGPGGFDRHLAGPPNLDVERMDIDDALAAFENGAIAVIAEERYSDPGDTRRIALVVPDGEFQTSLLVNQLKGLLVDYEDQLRQDRGERLEQQLLVVDGGPGPGTDVVFAYSILVPLLILTPVFLAGAVASDSFVQELQEGTFNVLRASPAGTATLLIGKLAIPIILVPLQILLWIGLLVANGLAIEHLGWLLGAATAAAAGLAALGVLVAFVVRQEGQAQVVYTLVVMILAAASLLLPRDPLNLLARLASGSLDAAAITTTAWLVAFAGAAIALTVAVAARRMDP